MTLEVWGRSENQTWPSRLAPKPLDYPSSTLEFASLSLTHPFGLSGPGSVNFRQTTRLTSWAVLLGSAWVEKEN